MAWDTAIGAYRLVTDREGLRKEINEQDQNTGTVGGNLKNFGSNWIRPGQALARIALGAADAYTAYTDSQESQRRADSFDQKAEALRKSQQDAFKKGEYKGLKTGAKSISAETLHNATLAVGARMAKAGLTPDYSTIRNKIYGQFMATGAIRPDSVYDTISKTWKTKSSSTEAALKAFEADTQNSLNIMKGKGLDTSHYATRYTPPSQDIPTDEPLTLTKTQAGVSAEPDDQPKAATTTTSSSASSKPTISQASPSTLSDKKLEKVTALLAEQNDLLRTLSMRTGFVS